MSSIFSLLLSDSIGSIFFVDLNNRQRWWIKQPLAVSKSGKLTSLNSISISTPLVGFTVFGGMGREPKKTPPLRLPSLARTCGYPIHPNLFIARGITMIYSFLIAPKGSLLSALSHPQIIRIQSNSVKSAQVVLNGVPAALISRIPVGRVS